MHYESGRFIPSFCGTYCVPANYQHISGRFTYHQGKIDEPAVQRIKIKRFCVQKISLRLACGIVLDTPHNKSGIRPSEWKNGSLVSTKHGTRRSTVAPSHSVAYEARLSLSDSASHSTMPCSELEFHQTWHLQSQIPHWHKLVPRRGKKLRRG